MQKIKQKRIDSKALKEKINDFNCKGIEFPMKLRSINKFLKQNAKFNFRINLFILEANMKQDWHVYPFKKYGPLNGDEVNLIVLKQPYPLLKDSDAVFHFFLIKNIDSFLATQYRRKNGYKTRKNCTFCRNCYKSFRSKVKLQAHAQYCELNEPVIVHYPKCDEFGNPPTLEFKSFEKSTPKTICGFLDFESALRKIDENCEICHKLECICDFSHTTAISSHAPVTYSLHFVDFQGKILFSKTYSGNDCIENLCSELLDVEGDLFNLIGAHKFNISLSKEEEKAFQNATDCHICKSPLNLDKVRDHCHYSNTFKGAAHSICNLKQQEQRKIPIFVHNLSGYDSHMLIKHMKSLPKKFSVLSKNCEKFRSIDFNSFRLLDSLDHLQAGIEELTNDLKRSDHDFPIIENSNLLLNLKKCDRKKCKQLLLQKSFYPYEWATSIKKLQNTKKLPPHKSFFSKLSGANISKDDYNFAKRVFRKFQCKSMLDYTELYCELDALLSAEIFLKYRQTILREFDLDPAHYYGTPSLAFDAMLKILDEPIELITKSKMINMVQSGIRGGVSVVNTRHALG